jgi:hypothetical protein
MKTGTIIAAAFTIFFNQNINANITIPETSESNMTRYEMPAKLYSKGVVKNIMTIHFKQFDVAITVEYMTVGTAGSNIFNGSTIEADVALEGNNFKIVLPKEAKNQLIGSQLKIVSGCTFKYNDTQYTVKPNTVFEGSNPCFAVLTRNFNSTRSNKDRGAF